MHTNNATIGTQNTEKTTKYFRTKAFKNKSKTIFLLPFPKKNEKGGKEGELSGRFIS